MWKKGIIRKKGETVYVCAVMTMMMMITLMVLSLWKLSLVGWEEPSEPPRKYVSNWEKKNGWEKCKLQGVRKDDDDDGERRKIWEKETFE